jgi:hypothetical protein
VIDLLGAIRNAIAALDSAVTEGGDLSSLVLALDELRSAKAELSMVERSLEAAVVSAMGDRWHTVIEGFGGIKVHGGKDRKKWRHEELWPLALHRARSAPNLTPEKDDDRLLVIVRAAVQPSYWRSTELKHWGIDPDEYCEVTWGRKTVELVR